MIRSSPSRRARLVAALIRLTVRRRRWGEDVGQLARRARLVMGAPALWGRLRALGLALQARHDAPVAVEHVGPRDTSAGVILYLHGGGFVACSPATHRPITAALARLTGRAVVAPHYRLAPEHPFPAALDDLTATYAWLLEQGTAPERIVVAGDSAGGGLALSLLVRLRARAIALPAGAVLFSPWTDLTGSGASVRANDGHDDMFRPENIPRFAAAYLAGADPRDPEASPRFADLAGLPPLLVQVSTNELLLDDARGVADAVRASGGEATLEEWPDLFHCWQMLDGIVPEARAALRSAARFIERRSGRPLR